MVVGTNKLCLIHFRIVDVRHILGHTSCSIHIHMYRYIMWTNGDRVDRRENIVFSSFRSFWKRKTYTCKYYKTYIIILYILAVRSSTNYGSRFCTKTIVIDKSLEYCVNVAIGRSNHDYTALNSTSRYEYATRRQLFCVFFIFNCINTTIKQNDLKIMHVVLKYDIVYKTNTYAPLTSV